MDKKVFFMRLMNLNDSVYVDNHGVLAISRTVSF